MAEMTIYACGVAENNPGKAAVGVRVRNEAGDVVLEEVMDIGNAIDSYATYAAVAFALETTAAKLGDAARTHTWTLCLCDTEVTQQLNGEQPITNPSVVPQFIAIHNLRVTDFSQLVIKRMTKKQEKALKELVTTFLTKNKR